MTAVCMGWDVQEGAQTQCNVSGECTDLERFEDFLRQLVWGPKKQLINTLLVLRNCELHDEATHVQPSGDDAFVVFTAASRPQLVVHQLLSQIGLALRQLLFSLFSHTSPALSW